MNKFDEERIEMIIAMLMYITKLSKRVVKAYVKMTCVYKNILDGDETTLYEGYSANLMEMVDEWKKDDRIPNKLKLISSEDVNECNDWLKRNQFQSSRQAINRILLENGMSPKTTFAHTGIPVRAYRMRRSKNKVANLKKAKKSG